LDLAPGADVAALVLALQADAGLAAELERCAFAIGTDIVARDHPLNEGDEVAVLPPVSGG
jgi:molybdopterin converting factor small subunit